MAGRLPPYRPGVKMVHLSGKALQWIGFVLVCLSSFSIAVLQRGVLKLDREGAMEAVSEAMRPGGEAMGWATGAVFCSLASTLAVPIFAKLLYEGWKRAEGKRALFFRLAVCAAVSEIPYDFATNGRLVDGSVQNPVWGLLLAAIALEITCRWRMRSRFTDWAFRGLIVVSALLWALLLRVYLGAALILLPVLFCFAAKWKWITMLGGAALTLLQFPAPLGMVFVHWYDEDKEPASGALLCALYPAQLLTFGLLAAAAARGFH